MQAERCSKWVGPRCPHARCLACSESESGAGLLLAAVHRQSQGRRLAASRLGQGERHDRYPPASCPPALCPPALLPSCLLPSCPPALLPSCPPALLPSCPPALLPLPSALLPPASCPPALLPSCPPASCPPALLPSCPPALLPLGAWLYGRPVPLLVSPCLSCRSRALGGQLDASAATSAPPARCECSALVRRAWLASGDRGFGFRV